LDTPAGARQRFTEQCRYIEDKEKTLMKVMTYIYSDTVYGLNDKKLNDNQTTLEEGTHRSPLDERTAAQHVQRCAHSSHHAAHQHAMHCSRRQG
jgi:hypothetical protein